MLTKKTVTDTAVDILDKYSDIKLNSEGIWKERGKVHCYSLKEKSQNVI